MKGYFVRQPTGRIRVVVVVAATVVVVAVGLCGCSAQFKADNFYVAKCNQRCLVKLLPLSSFPLPLSSTHFICNFAQRFHLYSA